MNVVLHLSGFVPLSLSSNQNLNDLLVVGGVFHLCRWQTMRYIFVNDFARPLEEAVVPRAIIHNHSKIESLPYNS